MGERYRRKVMAAQTRHIQGVSGGSHQGRGQGDTWSSILLVLPAPGANCLSQLAGVYAPALVRWVGLG
jgi:hypothetical protein